MANWSPRILRQTRLMQWGYSDGYSDIQIATAPLGDYLSSQDPQPISDQKHQAFAPSTNSY